MNYYRSELKLGILGGGQLGKMLIKDASQWDITTFVLDPAADCPASLVCSHFIKGDFTDFDAVYAFGQKVDILTIEIENINAEALIQLQKEGLKIYPEPHLLQIIQDKGLQKQFYEDNRLPSAPFLLFKDKKEILQAIKEKKLQYPFVQKLRKAGYDGKGVAIIKNKEDAGQLFEGASLAEERVAVQKEISVITAKNPTGEIKVFPPVEMIFNPKANLVEYQLCPAELAASIEQEACRLATLVTSALNITGLLAVELFLDQNNRLLINEVAPRPHNSGHHTIEAAYTSQYEQHLRAILNLPLGSTKILCPSVMVNLLGQPKCRGRAKYEGFEECLAKAGVNIHLYGKKETRPYRKMGHATIVATDLKKAKEKAEFVLNNLKITGDA